MTQKRPRDGWILDPHGPARVTNGTELKSLSVASVDVVMNGILAFRSRSDQSDVVGQESVEEERKRCKL